VQNAISKTSVDLKHCQLMPLGRSIGLSVLTTEHNGTKEDISINVFRFSKQLLPPRPHYNYLQPKATKEAGVSHAMP